MSFQQKNEIKSIEETTSYENYFPPLPPAITSLEHSNPGNERIYHLNVVIKLAFMAAMGGFLFGYDTGGAGGAILFLHRDFPDITDEQKELIISITAIGGAIGSLLAGPMADRYGRKISIVISDFLFAGGSFWLFSANTVSVLIAGRFIIGLGVGATCMIIPVYLAEISPKMIRGSMVTFNIICVTIGQIIAYLFAIILHPNWRLMFGFGVFPAVLQLFSMIFIKESPKYLIKAHRKTEAFQIMGKIYDTSKPLGLKEVECEISQMEEELKIETQGNLVHNLKELVTIYRKIIFVGVMLQVFQQFGGINTAMYYGPEMMKNAGFGDENEEISTLLASLPLACIDCLGTVVAFLIVDKYGRRYSMLRTLPGSAIGMMGLGLGTWIHSIPNYKMVGKWISCASLFLYLAFFSIGMNGQPWLVNSEIYPVPIISIRSESYLFLKIKLHLRGLGNAISTTSNWISDYILTMIFLSITSNLTGQVISYFVIGLINIAAGLFIYFLLPETKGKTLQEILMLFVKRKSKTPQKSICRKLLD